MHMIMFIAYKHINMHIKLCACREFNNFFTIIHVCLYIYNIIYFYVYYIYIYIYIYTIGIAKSNHYKLF